MHHLNTATTGAIGFTTPLAADTPLPDWITETTLVSQNNNADD